MYTPLYFICMFCLYIFEAYIAFSYGNAIFEARKNKKWAFLFCLAANLVLYLLLLIFNNDYVNGIAILLSYILIFKFAFINSWKARAFHAFFATGIMYASEYILLFIFSGLLSMDIKHLISDEYMFIELAFSSKLIYFIILKIVSLITQKRQKQNYAEGSPFLALLPLSTLFMTVVLRVLCDNLFMNHRIGILCLSSTILMIAANVIVFVIYEKTITNQQKLHDLELEKQKEIIDLEYLKILEEKDEENKVYLHDIKNHLSDIAVISHEPAVIEYVRSVSDRADNISDLAKTKNRLLDVIINKYALICKNRDIHFEYTAINENLSFICDYDLSAIFNNLLDNAVESAEHIHNSHIVLTLEGDDKYYKIILSNSCVNAPQTHLDNLVSKKHDKTIHGLGVKSIKKALKKYGGEYEWFFDKQKSEFKSVILISRTGTAA